MKQVKEPSTIFKYNGKLCEVVGIVTDKVIHFREIGVKPCICCGETKEYSMVEVSPNFQEGAEAIKTLVD